MNIDPDYAEFIAARLAEEQDSFDAVAPPGKAPKQKKSAPKAWVPKLGPLGLEVLRDPTQNILLHGERGGLKSGIGLHKLTLAMYENYNNLGLMYTLFRSAATEGGVWEKLLTYTLPDWFDGIGLDFSEPKMDDQKNRHIFIANAHGGWSRIVLKSSPPGTTLSTKLKGQEPGFVLFDEIAEADDADYFFTLDQQLRRPHIKNPQFVGTCNPPDLGDLHWLYDLFWNQPLEYPELQSKFKQVHVPIEENVYWTPEYIAEYQSKIINQARSKGDMTIVDRMVHGKWIARPIKDALFKDHFEPARHIIGDFKAGTGLRPFAGFPVILSYDVGPKFTTVTFMQQVPTRDGRLFWLPFDEVDHLGEQVVYRRVARKLIERMKFWREKGDKNLVYIHISDDSALNQWRGGGEKGSFDAKEFESEFNREAKETGFRSHPDRAETRLIGCPKGRESREARVAMIRGMLDTGELLISAMCPNTRDMFMLLPEDPASAGCHLRRSKWSHKFDSLSYGIFYYKAKGGKTFSYGKVGTRISRLG